MSSCEFNLRSYKNIFKKALDEDYQIIMLKDFFLNRYDKNRKILINRIDIDFNCKDALKVGEIFKDLNINGSFYFRLHAKEYNIFDFDNFNIIKILIKWGNEVSLHTETVDFQKLCDENDVESFTNEIKFFEEFFKIKIYGTASHGGNTGYNNLDFWKIHKPEEFGLVYEAYQKDIWETTRYISDSLGDKWKYYENGKLIENDHRCPCAHLDEGVKRIYLLTHPLFFNKEKS